MARYIATYNGVSNKYIDIVLNQVFIDEDQYKKLFITHLYQYNGFMEKLGCYVFKRSIDISDFLPRYIFIYYDLKDLNYFKGQYINSDFICWMTHKTVFKK